MAFQGTSEEIFEASENFSGDKGRFNGLQESFNGIQEEYHGVSRRSGYFEEVLKEIFDDLGNFQNIFKGGFKVIRKRFWGCFGGVSRQTKLFQDILGNYFFFSNFKEVSVGVLKRFKVFRWVQEVSKRFHGASMDSRSFQDSIGEHQKGSTHLNGRLEPM